MPRKSRARRFEPRYGVSQAAIEEEAKALKREVEDYEVLAPSDVDAKCVERHANCQHSWEYFTLLLSNLPEREQRVIYCLVFRDFYHVLELYLTHLHPPPLLPTSRGPKVKRTVTESDQFSEWLFDPK